MTLKEHFEIPSRYKQWSMGLMAVGALSLIVGFFMYGNGDEEAQKRFWATLLQNSVYFLLVVNAAMFFLCASTLAMGGWQISFRRVTEAISACVPLIGAISFVILMVLIFGQKHSIYEWLDKDLVAKDPVLSGKKGFLNPTFFTVWTILTIGLWIWLGAKMRNMSREIDNAKPTVEEGKKYIFKNTVWASLFIVWFALTVASTTPWLWLMSINPHWFSTMYSWYTFGSTFVAGMALITLFVIYMKNQGYLEYTNIEHLHDLGKFQFAFSIFWTYLWFSQFMLIWYANISEETIYFRSRFEGAYTGIFYLNLIINFLAPILIYMKRSSKRNYATLVFMSVALLFGHWLDFYQMVFASLFPNHVPMNLFDFGIAAGFVGLIIWRTGIVMSKYPLLAKNHPFFKESIIHHT
ncbi:MAG: quinol:cytochrome C oxidoreductase [Bacteroidetes bacterium]|nr:quinol:cytochrome C oxidoreductase [Bacteroidota bacterium]